MLLILPASLDWYVTIRCSAYPFLLGAVTPTPDKSVRQATSWLSDMEKEPLHHPARMQIIRIMGDEGGVSYSDLKEKTGLSTGSIYYHLGVLKDLLERKGSRYALNDDGRKVYQSIMEGRIFDELLPPSKRSSAEELYRGILVASLFERLSRSTRTSVMIGAILLAVEAGTALFLNVNQFLFVFVVTRTFHPAVSMVLSWLVVFLIFYFMVTSFYRRVGEFTENLSFLVSILVSFLPIYLYAYMFQLRLGGILAFISSPTTGALLQFVSAMWIASSLTFIKGVRLEHSMLMALIVIFLNDLPFIAFP